MQQNYSTYILICVFTPLCASFAVIFSFTDPATTEIYTLSLHDALPISEVGDAVAVGPAHPGVDVGVAAVGLAELADDDRHLTGDGRDRRLAEIGRAHV